jgi:hypothetical protein
MRLFGFITLTLLGAAVTPVRAQTPPVESTHHSMWLVYGGDHPITRRVGLVFDSQLRLTQDGDHERQLLVRPGLSYALGHHVKLSTGYTLMASRDDANDPLTPTRPEHRAWLSAQLAHDLGPVSFAHRYRYEHRWLPGIRVDDTGAPVGETRVTAERLRYSVKASVPLTSMAGSHALYFSASDEVFASFGGYAGDIAFDQNRASMGLGVRMSPTLRIEAGYMLQSSADDEGRFTERNHTLQIGAISTAAFRR